MVKANPQAKKTGIWYNAGMFRTLSALYAVLFHKKTPWSAKALLGAGLLYGVFPFDLIPDFLPILGEEDDFVVIVLAVAYFLWKTRHVRKEVRGDQTAPTK